MFRISTRVQLVSNLKREYDTQDGIQVRNLATYLATLSSNLLAPTS